MSVSFLGIFSCCRCSAWRVGIGVWWCLCSVLSFVFISFKLWLLAFRLLNRNYWSLPESVGFDWSALFAVVMLGPILDFCMVRLGRLGGMFFVIFCVF